MSGKASGKYSSLEAAQWLEDIAAAAGTHLDQARNQIGAAATEPAFRRVEEDVLIQRGLALFFAAKLRSAVLWRIYTLTGSRAAGEAAIARYAAGRDAWAAMAERAKKIYRDDISYGGSQTSGHWADRVHSFDADIADMKKCFEAGEKSPRKYDNSAAARALKMAGAKPVRPTVTAKHVPAEKCPSGQPLAIALHCDASSARRVVLHYRHVNQAERWQAVELKRDGNIFTGEIPADYTAKRYALQYYFEIETGPAAATLFPPLATDLANVPYFVISRRV